MPATRQEGLPIGAHPCPGGGVHFRVWAPRHQRIEVVIEDSGKAHPLTAEPDGYFSGTVAEARAGTRYRFRFADGRVVPDPASRYQPEGPHGPSEVVDTTAFAWTDEGWRGPREQRQVLYELHVGTFTEAGTWGAAIEHLADLARLGITVIELMPVSEFPGRFNWGYDGVAPYAPAHVYGTPDDMRLFVDRAHGYGIAVALDVVYNHMGPDGCYLRDFADAYFSTRYSTDWGDAINFDGASSQPVREFFLGNVEYWIRDFHLDGLRLDATQNIYDAGPVHIISEIVTRAHGAAGPRRVWIVVENEPQDTRLIRPQEAGGYGADAAWNDDFHHSAMVALTGRAEAYYSDHAGSAQELISAAKWGYLFQGQYYHWQKNRRGSSAFDVPARSFVHYLQNHDQIANSATGARVQHLTSPAELRALTALLHLMPQHALLFQGQEFNASAPFLFFADHDPKLAAVVHAGRREFIAQFPSSASPGIQEAIPDAAAATTFERSKLDHREREQRLQVWRLHRDLIRLARTDPVFAAQDARTLHGAVLAPHAFVLRYLTDDGDDRLLLVNLDDDLTLHHVPEPLLGLPRNRDWCVIWASEDPAYGGRGAAPPIGEHGWCISGRSAMVLAPARGHPARDTPRLDVDGNDG